jgi:hypothetical protein
MSTRTSTAIRRTRTTLGTSAGGLVIALALVAATLGFVAIQAGEAAVPPRNVAVNATPSASFTASHNNLNAINNGVHVNSGPPETSYWGTWTATDRPDAQFLQYDWVDPVEVDRTVMSFWTDAAPGTGANVTVPESWLVEWWDPAAAAWVPVPNPSGYGTSRIGTNETTFDPVVTTRLRASFHAYPDAAATSYSALGVSEWEVWGDIAAADPNTVIDLPPVHVRTTPGVVPDLPAALDVVRLNGKITPLEVTWQPVDPATLVAGAEIDIAGDLDGLARDATATLWVRDSLATTITAVDDASVITTVGVRPVLPTTVTATFDDDAMDSGIPVAWGPIDRSDYAAEGLFAVEGEVAGTELVPTAWVFVEPDDGSAPTPAFELATVPGEPDGGDDWFTSAVDVQVLPIDGDAAAYEAKVDDGDWAAVVDQTVPVTGDGIHDVAVRETGAETSQALTVRIDRTAPVSEATVVDRTVTLTATDATSGIDRVEYRTDDDWLTYAEPVIVGDEAVTLRHRAVDAAGNVGEVGSTELPAAELPAPQASVLPQVTGTPMVGRVLRATTGTWDLPDTAVAVTWLANGAPIAGATATTYVVRPADVGKRLTVRVTATKAGHPDGTARAAATRPVAKAATTTRLTAAKKKVASGRKVKLTVRVAATGVTATGVVRIYDGRRLVKTVQLRDGVAKTRVKVAGKGRHRLVARYAGTSWAATSRGSTTVRAT